MVKRIGAKLKQPKKKEMKGKKPSTIMGIDPAFRSSGFAIALLDKTENTMVFKMFKGLVEFWQWLWSDEAPIEAYCVVENSNLQNVTFNMKGNRNVIARRSRNAGANQAVSQIAVDICQIKYGVLNVKELSPKQKGKKLNNEQFTRLVKSRKIDVLGKTNQDKRDAGKLALMV